MYQHGVVTCSGHPNFLFTFHNWQLGKMKDIPTSEGEIEFHVEGAKGVEGPCKTVSNTSHTSSLLITRLSLYLPCYKISELHIS